MEGLGSTIPAGKVLLITMSNQVSSEDSEGHRFSGKLASDLSAGSATVAPKGTPVYGRVDKSAQAGQLAGRSQLELQLTKIDVEGNLHTLMTTSFGKQGKSSFHKTARNNGLGALTGAAFGDSDDAKTGAGIGLGTSVIRKGQSIVVPAGAVLEFRMTQPLTVAQ